MRTALTACLAAALALTACSSPYMQGPERRRAAASVKIVDAKRPPATLIAVDRSICLVTVDRYRNVGVGDAVFCTWRGGNDALPAVRVPGVDDGPNDLPRTTGPGELATDPDARRRATPRSGPSTGPNP
jgi:putative hemolysin